jgi:hypothetical protein
MFNLELKRLTALLRSQSGFELIFLFGSNDQIFDVFRANANQTLLSSSQQRLKELRCTSEIELKSTIDALLGHTKNMNHSEVGFFVHSAKDQKISRKLIHRLNERRQQLVSNSCPIFICLHSDEELHVATFTPDLWSVRSLKFNLSNT